jgi:DNA polymerase I-like protein with 3'-5' exonuclease and polymerase domains
MNAPIQGTVGDLMSLALVNLYMIREVERPHLQYRVVMSVHDQIIVTCPVEQVDETLEVMRLAMCEKCTIPGSDLVLGIDSEVCIRWSEPLTSGDVAQYPVLAKHMK